MPAIKRRKVGQCKYKRVISQEPPKEKRKQEEGEEVTLSVEEGSPVPKRRVCGGGRDPIFLEKKRIWNLKEAKLELWRRCRQRKGRIPG